MAVRPTTNISAASNYPLAIKRRGGRALDIAALASVVQVRVSALSLACARETSEEAIEEIRRGLLRNADEAAALNVPRDERIVESAISAWTALYREDRTFSEGFTRRDLAQTMLGRADKLAGLEDGVYDERLEASRDVDSALQIYFALLSATKAPEGAEESAEKKEERLEIMRTAFWRATSAAHNLLDVDKDAALKIWLALLKGDIPQFLKNKLFDYLFYSVAFWKGDDRWIEERFPLALDVLFTLGLADMPLGRVINIMRNVHDIAWECREGIDAYVSARAIDPALSLCHAYFWAEHLYVKREYDTCLAFIDGSEHKDHFALRLVKAEIKRAMRNFAESLEICSAEIDRFLEEAPFRCTKWFRAQLYICRAYCHYEIAKDRGQGFEASLADIETVEALYPRETPPRRMVTLKIKVLQRLGRGDEAIAVVSVLLTVNPNDIQAKELLTELKRKASR